MKSIIDVMPKHMSDFGDVSVIEFQAFCEILRQHWPRASVLLPIGDGLDKAMARRECYALLDDDDALKIYMGVLSGKLLDSSTGLTWLALAWRRASRFMRHDSPVDPV